MIDIIGTLRHLYRRVNQIFDFSSAALRLTETGGSLTADGTEQNVVIINTPLGNFKALKLRVDMSNMTWGDVTTIRWYERLVSGGDLTLKDRMTFEGPQTVVPDSPVKDIEMEPNRFGVWITLRQTAGTNRVYPWEWMYEA